MLAAVAGVPLFFTLLRPDVPVAVVLFGLSGIVKTDYLMQTQASSVRATPTPSAEAPSASPRPDHRRPERPYRPGRASAEAVVPSACATSASRSCVERMAQGDRVPIASAATAGL